MKKLEKFINKTRNDSFKYVQETNGYLYVTDGRIVVRKKGVLKEKPILVTIDKTFEFLQSLFKTETSDSKIFDTEKIKTWLIKTFENKSKYETKGCEACSGEGYVDWDFEFNCDNYTRNDLCPVCSGSGELETQPFKLLRKVCFSENKYIKVFNDLNISTDYLYSLLELGSVIQFNRTDKNMLVGKCGDYEFVCMSCDSQGDETPIEGFLKQPLLSSAFML